MSKRIPVDRGVVLYKHGKSWWIDCHPGDAPRIRKNTKTGDRAKALAVAREVAASILSGAWNVTLATETTIERAVEMYRTEYEPTRHSESTRYYVGLILPRFVEFVNARHRPPVTLDSVTRGDAEAFQTARAQRTTLHGKAVSPWTVNRDLREISIFCNWAMERGLVRLNPCKGVRPFKIIRRIRRILSPEECIRLVKELPPTPADMARLVLNAGLRLGEATHLRVEDLDLSARMLTIRSREDYPIKTRQERTVPLNAAALIVCERRFREAGPSGLLFPSAKGTIIDNRNAERTLHEAALRANVPLERAWYSLRHTFSTNAAKSLLPFALANVLGDTPEVADRFYVHLRGQEIAAPPIVVVAS